jgi:Ca2+-binding RTX toxin-like protein
MATVILNQATDMFTLPPSMPGASGIVFGPGSVATDLDYHNNFELLACFGAFNTAGGVVAGTIDKAWIDDDDSGLLPNIEITGLSYTFDSTFWSTVISAGNQATLVANLLNLDDSITGSPENDNIFGSDGNDSMTGGPGGTAPDGADAFDGGNGIDTVSYAGATAGLFAGLEDSGFNSNAAAGDSYIGVENLIGTSFNDVLYGDGSVNIVKGGAGNDLLVGKAGGDTLDGGVGSDTAGYDANLTQNLRADLLLPGTNTQDAAGDHYISIENLAGSTYDDLLLGNNAANVISGSEYPNLTSGADRLFGRGGNDLLRGYDNDDRLDGGPGKDLLIGGAGDDTLIGGPGKDVLLGGLDQDVFIFNAALSKLTNIDLVKDFSHSDDTIGLAHGIFKALTHLGTLGPTAFFAGLKAHDANDRIIYDRAHGALFYDDDGIGAHAQVEFAVLSTKPAINSSDFAVI